MATKRGWAKLKGKYKEEEFSTMTNARDLKFVEKVRIAKGDLSELDQSQLIARMLELEGQKDALEAQVKDLNVDLEALDQLIKQRFEANGILSLNTSSGRTIYLSVEPYVTVNDEAGFEKFMAEHPELDYLWSVPAKKLESFVKDLLDKDLDDQVPSCVKVTLKTSVNNRKS